MGPRSVLAVLLLALPTTSACGGGAAAAATPEGVVTGGVQALRRNDLVAFVRTTTSPDEFADLEAQWVERRKTPPSEEEAQQFAETLQKLTAKDAADTLYAELEPQLAGASQQFAMLAAMLPMMASSAAAQPGVEGVDVAIQGLARKLAAIDIADKAKLKRTLAIVTTCARDLDVDTLAELQSLSFEEALGRGGKLLGSLKQVLELYGLSLDGLLDSVQAQVVSSEAGKAHVQVDYDLFGTPQEAALELVEKDGRWVPMGR